MPTITWSLEADFDLNGSYETDLTAYVDMPGQDIRVGMGVGRDGRQQTGSFSFALSNWDGTFTAENASSTLYGKLFPGVPVRLVTTVSGTSYTIATMYAMRWKTRFQAAGASSCQVECEDIVWFLQRGAPVLISASTSRDTDGALDVICDAIGLTAGDRDFDDGVQDLPMHFAVLEKPIDALQAVAASEMGGQLYPNPLGQLRFENRHARVGVGALDATWGSGTDVAPFGEDYDLNPLEAVTAVTARVTHFHSGQADTVIWEDSFNMLTNPATSRALAPGEVYERVYQAGSAFLVLTDLEAVKDYLANAAADGSGVDLTSSLELDLTQLGSDTFRLRRRNTSATDTLYVTKLRVRGQPVEFYADQSIAQFSLSVPWLPAGLSQEFDLPFSGDADGKFVDYAYQELRVGRYPWPVLRLAFQAVPDVEIAALLAVDLGHLIRYASGSDLFQGAEVDDWWRVEAIDYTVPAGWAGETFSCNVTLIPAHVYRNLDAIAYDLFDRDDAAGDLGRSTQGAEWGNDSGFDIVSNEARANTDSLSQADIHVGASDQVIEVQLSNIGAGDEVGVTFRRSSDSNEYRVYLVEASALIVLERVVGGATTTLASVVFTVGTSHELRVIHQLNRVRVWVDGRRYIDVLDSGIGFGLKAGIMARNANGTTTFANFYAQGLNVEPSASEAVYRPARRWGDAPMLLRRARRAVS